MPSRATKGKAKQPSASAKKLPPRNAPAKSKNIRKWQASSSESDDSDDSSPASEGPSRKRKHGKLKKQVEVHDDDQSDIIPEEIDDGEPNRDHGANGKPGDEVNDNIFAYGF